MPIIYRRLHSLVGVSARRQVFAAGLEFRWRIARRFGGEDSAAFVNGVLDAIATAVGAKEKEKEKPGGAG